VEVTHQVVVPEDVEIGNSHRRLVPERMPPGSMFGVHGGVALVQGGTDSRLGHRGRIGIILGRRDRNRVERGVSEPPLTDGDDEPQPLGRLLLEP
jgi:hypothetical protein